MLENGAFFTSIPRFVLVPCEISGLDARLATISACNDAGARAQVGEGLVGMPRAFLRAGAHNVIAALREGIDASSTGQLMDKLYEGLDRVKIRPSHCATRSCLFSRPIRAASSASRFAGRHFCCTRVHDLLAQVLEGLR